MQTIFDEARICINRDAGVVICNLIVIIEEVAEKLLIDMNKTKYVNTKDKVRKEIFCV